MGILDRCLVKKTVSIKIPSQGKKKEAEKERNKYSNATPMYYFICIVALYNKMKEIMITTAFDYWMDCHTILFFCIIGKIKPINLWDLLTLP